MNWGIGLTGICARATDANIKTIMAVTQKILVTICIEVFIILLSENWL
jgi:hypothetical protein